MSKPKNVIEQYHLIQEERKRARLKVNISQVWYDLGSYYQLSSLGNVRKRNGTALTPTLRNGETYYLIDGKYYTSTELRDLINEQ